VLHRVREEVADHLVDALGVSVRRDSPIRGQHEVDTAIGADGIVEARLLERLLEQRTKLERHTLQGHDAGLEPREVQQLRHQSPEALHLGEHHAQRLLIRRAHAVDQVLQHRL
jgi:hypothetical protein